MAISHSTRVRGRLTPLEYLIAAQAKCAQAQAVLRQAASVHGRAILDDNSVQAAQGHLGQALRVLADIRAARNPAPPNPVSPIRPQLISSGRVLFATEESHHD